MPSTKPRENLALYCLRVVAGLLLGLYLAAPAYAFTPADAPLLSAAAVAPNVMLLVDDSGSMNNLIWAADFNPDADWGDVLNCNSDFSCLGSQTLDEENTNLFVGNLYRGGCSTSGNWYGFYRGFLQSPICLRLPDPVGGGNTRYSTAYLAYLLKRANGTNTDFTTGTLVPNDYRINVAREVSKTLVTQNRSLRIGLATFNPPTNSNPGPGGYIARSVTDLSPVSGSVSQTQANTNYNSLISSINGLSAIANTPLAETYYEITRYFRGMAPYYNSSPSTYTSPIQYRCQKNYAVVITDGLPTYDRTFPSNDPQAQGASKLPNWDGKNNDGNNPTGGDAEGDSLYLDDIAKFAYDIDMRSSGTDAAGKSWDSPDFLKQNMNTYTVGFTAANQMLSDAAGYGQGKYYQAIDSAGLSTALSAAFSDITSKAGSGGGGAASSGAASTSASYFQTGYDPLDWRGTIKSYGFNTNGTVNTSLVKWSSDNTIKTSSTPALYQSWSTASNAPITLAFNNFSSAQRAVLNLNLPTGILGSDLVEWSKGTNKTGLKTRTMLLGDIINSPLVVASSTEQTASDLIGDSSYTTYLSAKAAAMTNTLVVNGNDGFMSVIDSNSGARLYAYMPSSVLPSLHFIADPAYINGTSHKFLNDGQVGVFDAQFNNSAWKTVALGGLGAGGRAFFAVQLFDASANNAYNGLWELRAPDTPDTGNPLNDIGYAYARPEVARLPDGRWAAFIANGYGSNSGVAALYIVDIRDGSLIRKIVIDSTETTNGLSSIKLKVNAQNVVQAAYGGDLKGRLWKFDLSSTAISAWGLAFGGSPLFTAPGGTTQPITAQPLLADHPINGKMVFFGTGKFNETADKLSKDQQAFYAVWDADGGAGKITVSNLVAQSITGMFTSNGVQFITTSENPVVYPAQSGWYLPLIYNGVATGERVIYPARTTLGRIIFTTAAVDTTDPCASFGTGRVVELDAFTGKMLNYAVLDTNGDGFVDSSDLRSSGFNFSAIPNLTGIMGSSGPQTKIFSDSSGGTTSMAEKGGGGSRRIMWRQIQ
ncbi:pilus assembly protein [Pseudomonas gingeri]|uniref:Pilus assembly protein n=1 Tax=Pseudomonas gingeri TaxID=117681 RepID=A0A7Y8CJU4_9PSED|nr:PilC/PilY family type IV pilus protein [Pseudomonas gingeri]NWB25386.1 pilus assembly protein [Pseudomonas gingeri]NWC33427.1 pilus assembly protein [Pseudomonas gingeri]